LNDVHRLRFGNPANVRQAALQVLVRYGFFAASSLNIFPDEEGIKTQSRRSLSDRWA
jgi:hypothetical protein